MNFGKIWEIVASCVVSVGGVGAIALLAIKFSANRIADRLSQKYQQQLDKQMELYKTELSKKAYVSKTRFDAEFAIFRELSVAFSTMVSDISALVPGGYVEIPADPKDAAELDQQHYDKANKSTFSAHHAFRANEAFIPEEICQQYKSLLDFAALQLGAYTRRFLITYHCSDKDHFTVEDAKRTREMLDKWDETTKQIRAYLATLDVME